MATVEKIDGNDLVVADIVEGLRSDKAGLVDELELALPHKEETYIVDPDLVEVRS